MYRILMHRIQIKCWSKCKNLISFEHKHLSWMSLSFMHFCLWIFQLLQALGNRSQFQNTVFCVSFQCWTLPGRKLAVQLRENNRRTVASFIFWWNASKLLQFSTETWSRWQKKKEQKDNKYFVLILQKRSFCILFRKRILKCFKIYFKKLAPNKII